MRVPSGDHTGLISIDSSWAAQHRSHREPRSRYRSCGPCHKCPVPYLIVVYATHLRGDVRVLESKCSSLGTLESRRKFEPPASTPDVVLIAEHYARPSQRAGYSLHEHEAWPAPDLSPYLHLTSAFIYTSPDASQRLRSLESRLAPSPHSLRVIRLIEGVDRHDVKGMRPTVGLINSYLAVVVHHRPSDGRMGGLVNRFWQSPYRVLPSAGDDNGGLTRSRSSRPCATKRGSVPPNILIMYIIHYVHYGRLWEKNERDGRPGVNDACPGCSFVLKVRGRSPNANVRALLLGAPGSGRNAKGSEAGIPSQRRSSAICGPEAIATALARFPLSHRVRRGGGAPKTED